MNLPTAFPEPTRPNLTLYLVVKVGEVWHFCTETRKDARCGAFIGKRDRVEFESLRGHGFCSACLVQPFTCPCCENGIVQGDEHDPACTFASEVSSLTR